MVPVHSSEPGPLSSHRYSFSLNIVGFPSPGIFIAMRYNIVYWCMGGLVVYVHSGN